MTKCRDVKWNGDTQNKVKKINKNWMIYLKIHVGASSNYIKHTHAASAVFYGTKCNVAPS